MSKVRVGILGAKRGLGLARQFKAHPEAEVVALCEKDEVSARKFLRELGRKVEVYRDYRELLEHGLDVVVLAGYYPDHAPQAVEALKRGINVLSEVCACHTLAQGVELCRVAEEAQQKGVHYMLAENCCYFNTVQEMERLYREGAIGELSYAEGEYIHNGSRIWHIISPYYLHWRDWLPATYYCTHSLGPIVKITGMRPTKVVGFVSPNRTGRLYRKMGDDWGVFVLTMENQAIVRIIAWGYGPMDSTWYRLYGTEGAMETGRWDGDGRKIESLLKVHRQKVMEEASVEVYEPPFRRFAEEASGAGHGGGDFFVVWEFMEALAHNRRPPIDVYMAMDMTLPGILAYRSALMGGVPLEVPDFRREDVRRLYEADTWDPDPRKAGPGDPPPSVLGKVEISEDVKALLEEKTRRYREKSDG